MSSDFAFLNERLAQHYGLPKVDGVTLQRVSLPKDSVRGGLMTQASVLKVTANGTTTSPVLRGVWIMERMLGKPPPPPPTSVPAIEPDTRGAHTIRQQLDAHRKLETCAACHAKIDPAGFALESFDVFGSSAKTTAPSVMARRRPLRQERPALHLPPRPARRCQRHAARWTQLRRKTSAS